MPPVEFRAGSQPPAERQKLAASPYLPSQTIGKGKGGKDRILSAEGKGQHWGRDDYEGHRDPPPAIWKGQSLPCVGLPRFEYVSEAASQGR